MKKDRALSSERRPVKKKKKKAPGSSARLSVLKLMTRLYLNELRLRGTGDKDTHARTQKKYESPFHG